MHSIVVEKIQLIFTLGIVIISGIYSHSRGVRRCSLPKISLLANTNNLERYLFKDFLIFRRPYNPVPSGCLFYFCVYISYTVGWFSASLEFLPDRLRHDDNTN